MIEKKQILILPGDGIGPEVMRQALKLMIAMEEPLGLDFDFEEYPIGGESIRQFGVPLHEDVLEKCKSADAVLLGAVGSSEFDGNPPHLRPERAILDLRSAMGVYCNLRPVRLYNALIEASSLKVEIIRDIDLVVVRELTGGLYYGNPAGLNGENGNRRARNTMTYTEREIERIAYKAFDFAQHRRRKVTSVDKANVLVVSQLWRSVVNKVAKNFPDIGLEHMLVDNCAMQLIRDPRQFDVILTGNLFGDILSDEASMLTGSIGMLPSASFGDGTSLYEPIHGTAPDIAGKNIANPIAMINSVAMMLKYSFQRPLAASAVEDAVSTVLSKGYHTADINLPGGQVMGTEELSDQIIKEALHSFSTPYLGV